MASDYTERNFVALHIKKETRSRLNMAKAHFQATTNEVISQDEFLNILLDRLTAQTAQTEQVAELA